MGKTRVNISIDHDLKEQFKDHGISLSPFINKFMKDYAYLHFNGGTPKIPPEHERVTELVEEQHQENLDHIEKLKAGKPDLRDLAREKLSMLRRNLASSNVGDKSVSQKIESQWENAENGAFKQAFTLEEYNAIYDEIKEGK